MKIPPGIFILYDCGLLASCLFSWETLHILSGKFWIQQHSWCKKMGLKIFIASVRSHLASCTFFFKKEEIRRQDGGFTPSLPHHRYNIHGQGSIGSFKEISAIYRSFLVPTGVAKAAGQSPGNGTKFWNPLICKIDLRGFQQS